MFGNNFVSVLVNGSLAGFFKSTQGVKKGDPLSPLLLIITAEVLSRGLNTPFHNGGLHNYSLSRGYMQISHLSFADDIIIFTNGGMTSLHKPMDFLLIMKIALIKRRIIPRALSNYLLRFLMGR